VESGGGVRGDSAAERIVVSGWDRVSDSGGDFRARGWRGAALCFFNGPFVEPIEVWDEPQLLRFGVTANPAPLNELSP